MKTPIKIDTPLEYSNYMDSSSNNLFQSSKGIKGVVSFNTLENEYSANQAVPPFLGTKISRKDFHLVVGFEYN
jgi:hypothetical protein